MSAGKRMPYGWRSWLGGRVLTYRAERLWIVEVSGAVRLSRSASTLTLRWGLL